VSGIALTLRAAPDGIRFPPPVSRLTCGADRPPPSIRCGIAGRSGAVTLLAGVTIPALESMNAQPPAYRPRVVAFGGGTGLPVVLRGLRDRAAVTAVVTVADDGGSSGRLNKELGVPPPGDARNCLVALARHDLLAQVFSHRFQSNADLHDHAVGNLLIAALAGIAGGFGEGLTLAERLLDASGRVLPAAEEALRLVVTHADGTVTRGESAPRAHAGAIARVAVEPAGAAAPPAVLAAVESADLVVLAPGSLFTSTIPALLGDGVAAALARFDGPVIYVANAMTQPEETTGFTLSDHVRAIAVHVGPVVSDVLVHGGPLSPATIAPYAAEGAAPVADDRAAVERLGVRVHAGPMLAPPQGTELRHDAARVADAILSVAAGARHVS
jgi:uncharacterized cofD-like protein